MTLLQSFMTLVTKKDGQIEEQSCKSEIYKKQHHFNVACDK